DTVRLHRELLRAMPAPVVPLDLHRPAFLEGVYARATDVLATDLGPLLCEGLPRVTAPDLPEGGLCIEEPAGVVRAVESLMPGAPAPGWLWARIRDDLATAAPARTRLRRTRAVGLVAAAAVLLALVGSAFFRTHGGTPDTSRIVFRLDPRLGQAGDALMPLGR
ncbi:MAG: hypothetical protein KDC87_22330, partial [Planctomycetes bacterium]|nr:hypothetical protein [Planctomycetota bacterium]